MRSAPRTSVRFQLGLAILLAIVSSWILSGGFTGYISYLNFKMMREQMLSRPDIYPMPFPEPRFGILDFLIGPRGAIPGGGLPGPPPGPPPESRGPRPDDRRPDDPRPRGPMGPPPPEWSTWQSLVAVRLAIAALLALVTSAWLSRRFTRPLMELSKGAEAFQAGDLGYRIPAQGDNEFAGVAHAMNDMAERVADQIGRLEQDARSRRQFLANVAHELRSPITTMRTMAGALDEGLAENPERRKRATGALVRTSERMLRLVTELLELARLDLKALPLSISEVDLREVIRTCVLSHEPQVAEAGMTIGVSLPEGPIKAVVDSDRLLQVLDNLVENAISYAGRGAELRISLGPGDPAKVVIADTGRGIPSKDLPLIFDPFYRIDPARTPGGSHSGLGLSIARGLIQAHGGTLDVTSAEGLGTAFTISIPKT